MKECRKCGVVKSIDNYSKGQYKCKSCERVYYIENKERLLKLRKERFDSHNTGLYYVYITGNYVGTTNNTYRRNQEHMVIGREPIRVLSSFTTRKEALELEQFLHELGYEGKHKNNSYK